MTLRKIIVILGPTASGKTSLSIKLAKKYTGEIISADSRAIYQQLDIGTAKPTQEERDGVPHWGLDLIDPSGTFSAYDFQKYALEKIEEIRARNNVPFVVGGTGLYVDTLVYDYEFNNEPSSKERTALLELTKEELTALCRNHNISLPCNIQNKRHLVRTLETRGVVKNNRDSIRDNYIIVGITTDKETLQERIKKRAEQFFSGDIIEETALLLRQYSLDDEPMKSNIYRVVNDLINKKISIDVAIRKFAKLDWNLAKRQITWFKRNPSIMWLDLQEAEKYLSYLLSSSERDTIISYGEYKKREQFR
jgi:tRNA dimethylallyltransferase